MQLTRSLHRLAAPTFLFWLIAWAAVPARPQEKKPIDVMSRAAILQRNVPFQPAPDAVQRRKGDEVEVELVVSMMEHKLDVNQDSMPDVIKTRSYNRQLCGPVIRVRPGDLLKVRLKNEIDRNEKDVPFDEKNPYKPHGFNTTNLHTHGLNVSPEGRSDNVSLEVGPGESLDLCFDIHKLHPCGTMWYHAHKHGSVAMQLAGGMAGALIVEGGIDELPEIKAAREHVVVFQQLPYRVGQTEVKPDIVYANPEEKNKLEKSKELIRKTLINGVLQPTIEMRPGEVRRFRCVHAGLEEPLKLGLALAENKKPTTDDQLVTLYEIAVDGLPLGFKQERKRLLLQPGYRSDLLVKAPMEKGEYLLLDLPKSAEESFNGVAQPEEKLLARVSVKGDPVEVEMKLPRDGDLARYRLPSVEEKEIVKKDVVVKFFLYEDEMEKQFTVNDKSYGKNQVVDSPKPKLGTAEEWTLKSDAGKHPFHIHVNPFEVIRVNPDGRVDRTWRDTIFVSDTEGPVTIRSRFENYTGKTVLHCHNLRHEDQGMMMGLEIVGVGKPSRCPVPPPAGRPVGQAAPEWLLPDAFGKTHSWADHQGRRVLLVYSRGEECIHCRAQLTELKDSLAALREAGWFVVVIVPVPTAQLPREQRFADLLLSDEKWAAFRAAGCHDGRALHGTFLIEGGKVRWCQAGDEPVLEIASVVSKFKAN